MGLLDDAIRDHLELKRRRGADPTDIERAEREALGPVRRAPEELAPEGYPPEGYAPDPEPLASDVPLEPWAEGDDAPARGPIELEPTDEPFEEFEPYHEPDLGGEPATEPPHTVREPFPAAEPPLERERPLEREPPPPTAADEPPTAEHDDDQTTVEYHLDEPAPSGEQDDVLEETPEFLQDAPEHDRLWFEQRPPRDFDFNE